MTLAHTLARLLAACPDETIRDGPRGLQLTLAVFRTRNTADHAATVAMAYAEAGRYDEAGRWQRRAIAALQEAGRTNLEPWFRENLAQYQSGKPCRVPWPDVESSSSTAPAR